MAFIKKLELEPDETHSLVLITDNIYSGSRDKTFTAYDDYTNLSLKKDTKNNIKKDRYKCIDYLVFFIVTQIYSVSFWLRQSIAPITDVLEHDFRTNATQIGLLGSFVFLGYFIAQIPAGLTLQYFSSEFVTLVSTILVGFSTFLFYISVNIHTAYVANFFIGMFTAPSALSLLAISEHRFGLQNVAKYFGMLCVCIYGFGCLKCLILNNILIVCIGLAKFYCYIFVLGLSTLQAHIYQEYFDWRFIFLFLTISSFAFGVLLVILMMIESKLLTNTVKFSIFNPNYKERISIESNNNGIWAKLKLVLKNYLNWTTSIFGFCAAGILFALNGLWLISYLMVKYEYSRSLATFISTSFYFSSAIAGVTYTRIASLKIFENQQKLFLLGAAILLSCTLFIIYCNTNPLEFVIEFTKPQATSDTLSDVLYIRTKFQNVGPCAPKPNPDIMLNNAIKYIGVF